MPQESEHRPAETHLPLTPIAFEILLALADRDRHGYSILKDIRDRQSSSRLHPGTLYRALNRLLIQGLVVELDERPAPDLDDERRHYYRLTKLGQSVAAAETVRLTRQVTVARQRLVGVTE